MNHAQRCVPIAAKFSQPPNFDQAIPPRGDKIPTVRTERYVQYLAWPVLQNFSAIIGVSTNGDGQRDDERRSFHERTPATVQSNSNAVGSASVV
jgi:hypothetical protein